MLIDFLQLFGYKISVTPHECKVAWKVQLVMLKVLYILFEKYIQIIEVIVFSSFDR